MLTLKTLKQGLENCLTFFPNTVLSIQFTMVLIRAVFFLQSKPSPSFMLCAVNQNGE